MSEKRSLQAWLQLQETVHSRGIDLGLERVRQVAQRLGLLPATARSIIVAGTNGKGSTVACLAALLRSHGIKAGSFTSPHLLRYNERIRIDEAEASDAQLLAAFEAIEAARGDITLTFFEYNTLAALWLFSEQQVDFQILEVGLGGRLDAVNIIDAEAAIVCSIGMDHRDWLGDTLEAIGREKAGVFRAEQWAILSDPQMPPIVEREGRRLGVRLQRAQQEYRFQVQGDFFSLQLNGQSFESLNRPAMPGDLQINNAAAALAALSSLGVKLDAPKINRAFSSLTLPGRFQVVTGPVEWILDVAHNPPAAAVLARNLANRPCSGKTHAVVAILGDKDIPAIVQELTPAVHSWVVCGIDAPRGLSAEQTLERTPLLVSALTAPDIRTGMQIAARKAQSGDRIVVCGSFLAVTPALEALGLY